MILDDIYYSFKTFAFFQRKTPLRKWTEEKKNNFDFNEISKYFKYNENTNTKYQYITDKISQDIDLDLVFERIDRTYSSIGQQYIYDKIRTIHNEKIKQKEDLIENIKFDIQNRDSIIFQLNKIATKRDYGFVDLLYNKLVNNTNGFYYAVFSLIMLLSIVIASIFYLKLLILILPLTVLNIFFHYQNKAYQDFYRDKLVSLYNTISVGNRLSQNLLLKKDFNFNYIKNLNSLKKYLKFINFNSNQITSDVFIVFWLIIELIKISLNFEILFFKIILKKIDKEGNNLIKLFNDIGYIDTLIAISALDVSETIFCKPNFTREKKMDITKMIHPLVINCVANSLTIKNGVVLTGSNMSGKTTFIRAIAINALLAQTINRSFCESYLCPYFRINTSIRIKDDINENKSYFLEEVLTINDFFKYEKNGYNLFILDEIFKGTNTAERIALGISITKHLNFGNNFVFLSTHDTEIASYLDKSMINFNFSGDIINGNLTFSYVLKKGILKTTNALDIIKTYHYPIDIITLSANLLHS